MVGENQLGGKARRAVNRQMAELLWGSTEVVEIRCVLGPTFELIPDPDGDVVMELGEDGLWRLRDVGEGEA